MPQLRFAPPAEESIRELPKDKILLQRLWRELDAVANNLDDRTVSPPPFPHRQDRRLATFFIEDGRRRRWGFSVTLTEDRGAVVVCTIHGADAEGYAEFTDEYYT